MNGKKKPPQKQEESEEELTMETDGYDSMIENGTSEDSDSEVEQQQEMDDDDADDQSDYEEDSGSDDGFSDKEEEENVKQPQQKQNKRKPESKPLDVPQNKKPKTNVTEKVKAPTLEEINELKETRNLFHSNIFRLQVKEMLEEIKVKDKYHKYINNFMEQFKMFVKNLKNMPEKQDMDKLQFLKQSQVSLPINLQSLNVQQQKVFQFQFIKPTTEPFFLGACNTHTLLGPKLQADIGVLMPEECWQKENYLNLQYDQKRAFYLTYLTQKLVESKFAGLTYDHLKFNYYNNNPLKPVLEITPPEEAGKHLAQKLCLRIFIGCEQNSFKLNRFVPWNNNIRSSLFELNEDEESVPLATPSYNANVLFDLTMHENQKLLHEVFDQHKNLQEGLLLLKVWLRQRQLDVGYGGFNAHILAMFIAYLFKQRKLHTNMSSYQVARNVWNHLGLFGGIIIFLF